MRIIPDQLRSKNLVPFKKRHGRYKIPGMTPEHEILMDRVDPDLSQEEQSFVRHYLGYADALIRGAEENASLETLNVSAPESSAPSQAPSADGRPEQQPPADAPPASLVDESKPATQENPIRAA